jgi:hypothetical protein
LTEKYADRVSSLDRLFEPIKNAMSKQAYGSWETCVNEHVIRAINIRMVEQYSNTQQSKALLNRELGNRFIYIEPLIEKLKEFEKQRDENHITFSDFYPELINLLDSLKNIEFWKEINFIGPISAVHEEEKIAYIYPTQDSDKKSLKIAQNYAFKMFNTYAKSKDGLFIADTAALKTDLSEYGIIVYGTIESNLLLKQHSISLPFRLDNQTIYMDKEFAGKNIKLITCVPNPFNPKKGMVIYTAHSNKDIKDINSVRHGHEDYILFESKRFIIKNGWYNANWKCE